MRWLRVLTRDPAIDGLHESFKVGFECAGNGVIGRRKRVDVRKLAMKVRVTRCQRREFLAVGRSIGLLRVAFPDVRDVLSETFDTGTKGTVLR